MADPATIDPRFMVDESRLDRIAEVIERHWPAVRRALDWVVSLQLPFGGMKNTGNGHREAGPQSLDEFTEWKAVSIDFSGRVQKAQGID